MQRYRDILPADNPRLGVEYRQGRAGKRRRECTLVKIACQVCQRRKVKCDGSRPACISCRNRKETCHYDIQAPDNTTRYQALRMSNSKLERVITQNLSLLEQLRHRPYDEAIAIFEQIREGLATADILKLVAEGDELLGIAKKRTLSMGGQNGCPPSSYPDSLPISFSQTHEQKNSATLGCQPEPAFSEPQLREAVSVAASSAMSAQSYGSYVAGRHHDIVESRWERYRGEHNTGRYDRSGEEVGGARRGDEAGRGSVAVAVP